VDNLEGSVGRKVLQEFGFAYDQAAGGLAREIHDSGVGQPMPY
jgi:hypothetical protein